MKEIGCQMKRSNDQLEFELALRLKFNKRRRSKTIYSGCNPERCSFPLIHDDRSRIAFLLAELPKAIKRVHTHNQERSNRDAYGDENKLKLN